MYRQLTKNVSKKLTMPPARDKISTLFQIILVCAFWFMFVNCESAVASENISITHIEESCIQKCPDHVSEIILYKLFVSLGYNLMIMEENHKNDGKENFFLVGNFFFCCCNFSRISNFLTLLSTYLVLR